MCFLFYVLISGFSRLKFTTFFARFFIIMIFFVYFLFIIMNVNIAGEKSHFLFCPFFPFNSIYYLITINMSFLAKKLLFCPFFFHILSRRRLGTSHLAIVFEKYFTSCIVRNYIEDITRWREDMNFIFEWQNSILRTSAAS